MATTLAIVGAAGRMGNKIITLAAESGRFDIIAAIDQHGHPDIGKKIGPVDILLSDEFPTLAADIVIDFSLPQAFEGTIEYCLKYEVALVSGTTGLSQEQLQTITEAARKIPIVYATNMSVGMNVLFSIAGRVASMLGSDYDIEIVEQHHRFKKDAPSGTALTLAENICKATNRDFPGALNYGRSGKEALREAGEIGVHAVRVGDITGIHSIIFGALGETVTINHSANSRDTFVRGALRAAKWLTGKKPGLYSMAEVIGI